MILMVATDWFCARCGKKQEFTTAGFYGPHVTKPMVQICKKCEKDFFKWLKCKS